MKVYLVCFFSLISFNLFSQSYNFNQGVKFFEQGDYKESIDYFDREIADNEKNGHAHYYKSLIYKSSEDYQNALKSISRAIEVIQKKDLEWKSAAFQVRGQIQSLLNNYPKAIIDYNSALALGINKVKILQERGDVYYFLRDIEKAQKDFYEAIKIDESDTESYLLLCKTYLFSNNLEKANDFADKAIRLSSKNAYAFHLRSIVNSRKGNNNQAISDILTAIDLEEDGSAYLSLFLSMSLKNTDYALSKINSILIRNKNDYYYTYLRGRLHYEIDNYKSAIEDFSTSIKLMDTLVNSSIYNFRGCCYRDLGNYSEAINDFTQAIRLNSTSALNYGYRGDTKRLKGDYNGALTDLDTAVFLNPEEAWFYYKRGWVKSEFLHNTKSGIEDYSQAISLNPDFAYPYLHRGELRKKEFNMLDEAKSDFEKILEIDTVVLSNGNCRAYALFQLGKTKDAKDWMTAILKEYPNEGNYYDAACLYSKMGETSESLKFLELSLENGNRDFVHIANDDDLDNIRSTEVYKLMMKNWKEKSKSSEK